MDIESQLEIFIENIKEISQNFDAEIKLEDSWDDGFQGWAEIKIIIYFKNDNEEQI